MATAPGGAYIESAKARGIIPGLESITELLLELGSPQDALKVVHVTGTNGKGSSTAFLASILRASDYSVGQFVSPWLVDMRESILVNGNMISSSEFDLSVEKVKLAANVITDRGTRAPTEFELMVAVAMVYFSGVNPDVVIVEVGMGGLHDATNVFTCPLAVVMTPISLDHVRFLGNTVEEIAENKAGIIKEGASVVVAPQSDAVKTVIASKAKSLNASIHYIAEEDLERQQWDVSGEVFQFRGKVFKASLLGMHQLTNAATAITCGRVLSSHGFDKITDTTLQKGLDSAIWPCRFEVISPSPVPVPVVVDGAHNQAGATQAGLALKDYFPSHTKIVLVMAMNADKDIPAFLGALLDANYGPHLVEVDVVATQSSHSPNPLSAEKLAEAIKDCSSGPLKNTIPNTMVSVRAVEVDISAALQRARELVVGKDLLLIIGSLYMVGMARKELLNKPKA